MFLKKIASKKYLIISSMVILGIAIIPMLLNNNRSIREERGPTKKAEKIRCKALTSSGTRCQRKAISGKEFCWQHQN